MSNGANIVWTVAVWLVPLVIAIVFHEVAHGLAARALGDRTAEAQGRLTLNPLAHVDPIGTVVLPMMLAIAHAPIFGWARPVPVVAARMRHPRRDMVLVALAGPGMNIALATLATLGLAALVAAGAAAGGAGRLLADNLVNFLLINVFLGIFNLLPLPPFDGGHVVEGLLPRWLVPAWRRLGRLGFPLMVVLLVVLPMLLPQANVVARVVGPIARGIAGAFLGAAGLPA